MQIGQIEQWIEDQLQGIAHFEEELQSLREAKNNLL